ncbi:MAG: transcription antitermination factor NusB [Halanaerobiales bacterium]|nr:transcription antitermination factor NusB [Halanaerobiales bacterium]
MMKLTRHKQRIWAMQILYGLDLQRGIKEENALREISLKKNELSLKNKDDKYYFEEIVLGVINNLERIDKAIERNAIGWHLYRMPVVDRNILRIALYEFFEDMPIGILINEAVELAKEFGTDKSSGFINGVLSNVSDNAGDN